MKKGSRVQIIAGRNIPPEWWYREGELISKCSLCGCMRVGFPDHVGKPIFVFQKLDVRKKPIESRPKAIKLL